MNPPANSNTKEFVIYLGVLLWGGLWLRDPRIRTLLPFSST